MALEPEYCLVIFSAIGSCNRPSKATVIRHTRDLRQLLQNKCDKSQWDAQHVQILLQKQIELAWTILYFLQQLCFLATTWFFARQVWSVGGKMRNITMCTTGWECSEATNYSGWHDFFRTPNSSFANSFCTARRVSEVFFLELKDFLPAWIITRLSSQFYLHGKLNNVTLCAASWAEMPLALLSPNTQYTPLLTFFWRYFSLSEEVSNGNGAGSALRPFQTNEPLESKIITDALEGVSSEQ